MWFIGLSTLKRRTISKSGHLIVNTQNCISVLLQRKESKKVGSAQLLTAADIVKMIIL